MYKWMYIKNMAKQYSIAQARSNLAQLVDQAETGSKIEITRRGKPVAVVLSVEEYSRLSAERAPFRDAFNRFLHAHPRKELGFDEKYFESLRTRESGRDVSL